MTVFRIGPILLSLLAFAVFPGTGSAQEDAAYKDPHQPVDKRVSDLLLHMTLDEKASQLLSQSPAIDHLGVPAYDWWNECLHGVARAGRATVFPEPIGMAATWDTNLLYRVATAISDEARAKHQEFLRRGKRGIYEGLTFWSPNINLFRDPRWGRGMETYGEDPFLTGSLAVQFIRGLQGDDPKYLKVIATAKHYAVHSGPESTRHEADIAVTERDLRDTYLPQFEMAVEQGGANSVMCAYNSIDGQPACANARLLQTILRKEWKFPGYVVSDCGAISDIWEGHEAAADPLKGLAMALKAGTDLDCGLEYQQIVPAIRQGLLTEADVDASLRRLLTARFRLGMFDPPEMVPWTKIPYSANDSPQHAQLALETARKSIVLLKNEGGILPLKKTLGTLAVIGPNADDVEVLLGNYNGQPSHPVTPLAGIKAKLASGTKVIYARGASLATGIPSFETVPSSALSTTSASRKKPGLLGTYYNTANFNRKAYVGQAFVSAAMRKAALVPASPRALFTRVDPAIDFDWHDRAPRPDMQDDNFGVRWTGFLVPPATGSYQLGANGLNAFEIYLSGKLIAHRDNVHERGYEYQTVQLKAGKPYPIRVDFHEVKGDADIRLVWEAPHPDYAADALQAAQQADAVVMFLGLSPRLEGEEMKVKVDGFDGGDRVSLGLPQVQESLLRNVTALGKPVVLVLLNGSAVAVNWAREHVPGIIELWYPGQAGGTALADVLFGDYNPGGRLPVTFYQSESQLPAFDDYNMKGRTYRYFTAEPLYPFGYGLSYSKFSYSNLQIPSRRSAGSEMRVSATVTNVGALTGDEVVQLYITHQGAAVPTPIRTLVGFERITLAPRESRSIEFAVTPRQLALIDAENRCVVEPGAIRVSFGGKQPGSLGLADAKTTEVVTGECQLTGVKKYVD